MHIPQRIGYVLERDQELDGAVKLSVAEFEPWIKDSTLPFFPEYTDHGIGHIENVLASAVSLIRDESWNGVTPGDAAVLILAVLLHDCAMHLSEDGFVSLLAPNRSAQIVPGLQDKPWNALWEEFCGEASRFDGRTLVRLFGDPQPIRRPPLDPNQLTKRDRLLVGEFLRRHHPRLAQEIALFGVPTTGANPLVLKALQGERDYIARLSGVTARSHGADVRQFLPYLHNNFDIRQYKGVHAVFLMTLLRVADYIQVEAERAPSQVLQIKRLASPVSRGEWKAHHAVKDIRSTHQDPEALFVDVLPEDIDAFLRVEEWLKGIQSELDASWAVLGEVYGRYEGLNRLGLVLRRVRSSLDDKEGFARKVKFLPRKAFFRAADADLIKLLIEPLYGNKPEIGIRELLQNAVDAVRELKQYRADVPSVGPVSQIDQDSDVVIAIAKARSKGQATLTISDKGIGMTPEIIIHYFLTAGASFRRSEDWRKTFETVEGKSKVLRAGRFGIGALASFLLGSEIEVSTRHVDASDGVWFKAAVDTDSIELRRIDRPVGTTIQIVISEGLAKRFRLEKEHGTDKGINWDWYALSNPKVRRIVFDNALEQKYEVPDALDSLPVRWRKIVHPDYASVLWTYSGAPNLLCNGLRIDKAPASHWNERFGLTLPHVSVFDPDGRLPLNLQRTSLLEDRYPFDEVLMEDVIRDMCAYALVHGPRARPKNLQLGEQFVKFQYSGSHRWAPRYGRGPAISQDWYFTSKGFGYFDPVVLHKHNIDSVLLVHVDGGDPEKVPFTFTSSQPTIIGRGNGTLWNLDVHVREMAELGRFTAARRIEGARWNMGPEGLLRFLKRRGCRLLVSELAFGRAMGNRTSHLPRGLQRALSEEWEAEGWHLLRIGDCPDAGFDFTSLVQQAHLHLGSRTVVSEIYLDLKQPPQPTPVGARWLRIIGQPEIPYDLRSRSLQMSTACEELANYIAAHEKTGISGRT